jgi:hypothetical protein
MRTKKISFLMENGLPSKFLINLSDKQVDNLYTKYLGEQVKATTMVSSKNPNASQIAKDLNDKGINVTMTEMGEDADLDDSAEKESGFDPYAGNSVGNDNGPSSNDGYNNAADGFDILENKKKSKDNPWAVCTSQMGKEFGTTERSDWSKPQMAKYERCVKDVKKSIKEGNNPYESLLESHIIKLVKKHINENMQLVSFKKLDKPVGKMYTSKKSNPMEAAEPAVKPRTAPPKTKPGVKPSKPNPYQPPKETPKEKPRAQDYKSMFISALNQLLGK